MLSAHLSHRRSDSFELTELMPYQVRLDRGSKLTYARFDDDRFIRAVRNPLSHAAIKAGLRTYISNGGDVPGFEGGRSGRDVERVVAEIARQIDGHVCPASLFQFLEDMRSDKLDRQEEERAREAKEQRQRRKEQQQRDEESRAARVEQNRARQLEIDERRRRRSAADERLQALLSHRAWDMHSGPERFEEPEGAQAELDELRAVADEKLVARVEVRRHRTVRLHLHMRVSVPGPLLHMDPCMRAGEAREGSRARVG